MTSLSDRLSDLHGRIGHSSERHKTAVDDIKQAIHSDLKGLKSLEMEKPAMYIEINSSGVEYKVDLTEGRNTLRQEILKEISDYTEVSDE